MDVIFSPSESMPNLLFYAIEMNDIDAVKECLNKKHDITTIGKYGNTPLLYAINMCKPCEEIISLLLKCGIDVNTKNSFGCDAIFYSVTNRGYKITEALLHHGAVVTNVYNEKKDTLFHVSVNKSGNACDLNTMKILISHGISLDIPNADGDLPRFYKKDYTREQFINLLTNV